MTFLSGFVDAVGYSALGHLYVSFMSGNSTQFGMAVAGGDMRVVGWAGAVITLFVVGAFLGSIICAAGSPGDVPRVLACELMLIVSVWILTGAPVGNVALLLVAVAMGMQNAIHVNIAGAAIGKSFVTGALYGTGAALAQAYLGRAGLKEAGAYAVSWAAFVVGVMVGALTLVAQGMSGALLIAAGVIAGLISLTLVRTHNESTNVDETS